MGEREKDTSYPASLFPLRLRTRVWGHFFTQLNPNTNGVDHWETWQHGTRKSEAESVCDKQGEIPPLILLWSYIICTFIDGRISRRKLESHQTWDSEKLFRYYRRLHYAGAAGEVRNYTRYFPPCIALGTVEARPP